MKKAKLLSLGLLLTIGFMACKKNDTPSTTNLKASKSSLIKKGDPVLFTLSRSSENPVNWSVKPSANTQVNPAGNQAAVKFGAQGNYFVTAVSGIDSVSVWVSVSDSTNAGVGGSNNTQESNNVVTFVPFSADETIKITASKIDTGDGSILIFSALTTNSYPNISNYLGSTFTESTSGFEINYNGVAYPLLGGGTAKAGGFSYINPNGSGIYKLTIILNGKTYTGEIVRTGNNFAINWPYASGVSISTNNL